MTGLDQNIIYQFDVDQLCYITKTLYILTILHTFRVFYAPKKQNFKIHEARSDRKLQRETAKSVITARDNISQKFTKQKINNDRKDLNTINQLMKML